MMTIRGIVIQLVLPITSICDDAVGGGGDCLFSFMVTLTLAIAGHVVRQTANIPTLGKK